MLMYQPFAIVPTLDAYVYQPLIYVSPFTIVPTLDAYVPTLDIRLTFDYCTHP